MWSWSPAHNLFLGSPVYLHHHSQRKTAITPKALPPCRHTRLDLLYFGIWTFMPYLNGGHVKTHVHKFSTTKTTTTTTNKQSCWRETVTVFTSWLPNCRNRHDTIAHGTKATTLYTYNVLKRHWTRKTERGREQEIERQRDCVRVLLQAISQWIIMLYALWVLHTILIISELAVMVLAHV